MNPPRILLLALLLHGSACAPTHIPPEAPPGLGSELAEASSTSEPTTGPAPVSSAEPEPPLQEEPSLRPVTTGLEVLLSDPTWQAMLEGRALGLVTNAAATDHQGRTSFERLVEAPWADVRTLFTPEHGFYADIEGEGATAIEGWSGRSYGLFGEHRAPTPPMLEGLDVLVFDMQSVGVRFYTYISTLVGVMAAARDAGIPVVVLDRPNPIAPQGIGGNLLDRSQISFVGILEIPWRYGLTLGEMARVVAWRWPKTHGCPLLVVPLEGWDHQTWFDQTDLTFHPPSPAMVNLDIALSYPGFCLLEGTRLSLGRGTDHAFQLIAAPWLDAEAVAARVEELAGRLGAELVVEQVTPHEPSDKKFAGQPCPAVRVVVTDRDRYDPIPLALELLEAVIEVHPTQRLFHERHFDRLAGTQELRSSLVAGQDSAPLLQAWSHDLEQFAISTQALRLYP